MRTFVPRIFLIIFLMLSVGCASTTPEGVSSVAGSAPKWADKSVRIIEDGERILFVGLATEAAEEGEVENLARRNSAEILAGYLDRDGFSIAGGAWSEGSGIPLTLVDRSGNNEIEIRDFVQIDSYTECENVLGKRIYKVFVLMAVPKAEIERLQGSRTEEMENAK